MHAHERMELFYFISGGGFYNIEGSQYELHPGDIFVMRNAETHKLLINPNIPYERISVHFSPAFLSSMDPDGQLLRPFIDHPLGQSNQYLRDMINEDLLTQLYSRLCNQQIPPDKIHLQAMIYLPPLLQEICNANSIHKIRTETEDQSLAYQLVAFINCYLFDDISLETVCNHFFISKSQVNRIFMQSTGTSIWRYITIKRLLAARSMIQKGTPVGQACILCGFHDYSAFFRAYSKKFGCNPATDARRPAKHSFPAPHCDSREKN